MFVFIIRVGLSCVFRRRSESRRRESSRKRCRQSSRNGRREGGRGLSGGYFHGYERSLLVEVRIFFFYRIAGSSVEKLVFFFWCLSFFNFLSRSYTSVPSQSRLRPISVPDKNIARRCSVPSPSQSQLGTVPERSYLGRRTQDLGVCVCVCVCVCLRVFCR